MSAPPKKQTLGYEESGSDSDEDQSENEEGMEYTGDEEIQVDFEGRSPTDSDYHGIKQLLAQLFLKAHLNLSELTDIIIGQSNIGSVVKQSGAGEINEDDDDDDDDDLMGVFAVTSAVSLSSKKKVEVVQQLRSLLVELSSSHATEECKTFIKTAIEDADAPLGLIINERFINIPPQLAVPILQNLSNELKKAVEKKEPYNFSHLIFICKLYKDEERKGKRKKMQDDVIWSNPEEEIIDQMADYKFEFCVKDEVDSGLSGNWLSGDDTMIPYRRVLIIEANKFDSVIEQIKIAVQR
ncbi:protein BCCIP homolog [Cimex lectularius]|uniref:Protein BCCIP homolog n=1 Tax=Cimex lectularius TaxID=79782 RepID=A0A8I6RFZ4_CIMLE|nr:protein BCCIP homolog [Cimex lectularius]